MAMSSVISVEGVWTRTFYFLIDGYVSSTIALIGEELVWSNPLVPRTRIEDAGEFTLTLVFTALTHGRTGDKTHDIRSLNISVRESNVSERTSDDGLVKTVQGKTRSLRITFEAGSEVPMLVRVDAKVSVTRSKDCADFTGLCETYCGGGAPECLPGALVGCVDASRVGEPACRRFLLNYAQFSGPNQELSSRMEKRCKSVYGDKVADALKDPFCACHMGSEFYDGIVKSLEKDFENIDKALYQKRCIVSACAESPFPDVTVGSGGCKGVECVNIVEVSDQGPTKYTINQKGSERCINIRSRRSS